jgi:hypothetical protein
MILKKFETFGHFLVIENQLESRLCSILPNLPPFCCDSFDQQLIACSYIRNQFISSYEMYYK